jgi:accessory colonization factor AcfC
LSIFVPNKKNEFKKCKILSVKNIHVMYLRTAIILMLLLKKYF